MGHIRNRGVPCWLTSYIWRTKKELNFRNAQPKSYSYYEQSNFSTSRQFKALNMNTENCSLKIVKYVGT